jgi:hypothetical protein
VIRFDSREGSWRRESGTRRRSASSWRPARQARSTPRSWRWAIICWLRICNRTLWSDLRRPASAATGLHGPAEKLGVERPSWIASGLSRIIRSSTGVRVGSCMPVKVDHDPDDFRLGWGLRKLSCRDDAFDKWPRRLADGPRRLRNRSVVPFLNGAGPSTPLV